MDEFLNRISLQRKVIKIVNDSNFSNELTGLSKLSIEKWILENNIQTESEIVSCLLIISSQLFFLANKSQEQITEDYKKLSLTVTNLVDKLKAIIIAGYTNA